MMVTRSIEEKRDEVLSLFRDALETKLVRWTDELTSTGDFEGRDFTLEIFDIPVGEQREMLRRLRELRHRSEKICGAAILLVFHTPEATRSHYAGLLEARARIDKSVLTAPLSLRLVSGSPAGPFVTRIEERPRLVLESAA
jgi:hypothetical protein